MKMSKNCPWCQKPMTEVTGPEMTALRGTIRYGCGTIFSLYEAMIQVTTPCKPMPQWLTHEEFHGQV